MIEKLQKKQILKTYTVLLLLLGSSLFSPSIFCLDLFEEGLSLYQKGLYAEAIPLLYQASLNEATESHVFVYLGLSYQQIGKNADAISTFIRGTSSNKTDHAVLFFNAGNVYFIQNSFTDAELMYTKSLEVNKNFSKAWLNRANARIKIGKMQEALQDYTQFLLLDPANWQANAIKQMIELLQLEEQERELVLIKAEAKKKAEEAEKAVRAQQYQQLLDTINASLLSVDGASVFSAGSEDILDYSEEDQLE